MSQKPEENAEDEKKSIFQFKKTSTDMSEKSA